MIPSMILFGLLLGRWWWSIPLAAVVWGLLILAVGDPAPREGRLEVAGLAALLGAVNAAVGVALHQFGWWAWRTVRSLQGGR